MQLIYSNKQPESQILTQSKKIQSIELDKTLPILFSGDNFHALSVLLNSGYHGKIDLIYIDPPYNTQQIFTISDERISTISRTNHGITAYEDNRSMANYLEFMRERLILMRELLCAY